MEFEIFFFHERLGISLGDIHKLPISCAAATVVFLPVVGGR